MSEVLEELKRQGKITDKDIDSILTSERKKIIDFLHMVLCKDDHDSKCTWYQEELMEDTWNQQSHRTWISLAKRILYYCDLTWDQAINEDYLDRFMKIVHLANDKRTTLLLTLFLSPDPAELIPEALAEDSASRFNNS